MSKLLPQHMRKCKLGKAERQRRITQYRARIKSKLYKARGDASKTRRSEGAYKKYVTEQQRRIAKHIRVR